MGNNEAAAPLHRRDRGHDSHRDWLAGAPDLPEPSDGAVCVAETRLPAMRDHSVLKINHIGMLLSAGVARQVRAFVPHGAFINEPGA
jgi:hypothetical protein